MSDFIYIIILTSFIWLADVANTHTTEKEEQIVALQETNSLLWAEGENVTARLKACEKKGRR